MDNSNLKIALVSPELRVADTDYNASQIIDAYKEASENGSDMVLFPELAVTGATCGDLFFQNQLYKSNVEAVKIILKATEEIESTIIFGSYLRIDNKYYDCIFIAEGGALMGIVPKMKSVNFLGIDFGRWFESAVNIPDTESIETEYSDFPVAFGDIVFENPEFGVDVMVKNGSDIFFYEEDDEDVKSVEKENPLLILNPTADSTQAGHIKHRINFYKKQSEINKCMYGYVNPGVLESTTDLVFAGQSFVAAYGENPVSSDCFNRQSTIAYWTVGQNILKETHMADVKRFSFGEFEKGLREDISNPLPFIPKDKEKLNELCSDAFLIQANGLATRLSHVGAEKAIIGISGGLDSTLALLVAVEAFHILNKNMNDLMTVTMPGFGTSERTFENALNLMNLLGTDLKEISIVDSVKQHFKDIGHDINNKNKAYENAQARERTQILMDIANDVNGIVIGTGDLSEAALGWCTYGGDHMSMYGVNDTIPKTFIPYILNWVAENKKNYSNDDAKLEYTLKSVIETPISPELLPADEKGEIAQKTEDSVGPYELHDYFIYHTLINKLAPVEILNNAEKAFKNVYTREIIKKWLKVFYTRFFSQQFKRNCCVEGPMATHISLSPRGGFVMPSDAVSTQWIRELDTN